MSPLFEHQRGRKKSERDEKTKARANLSRERGSRGTSSATTTAEGFVMCLSVQDADIAQNTREIINNLTLYRLRRFRISLCVHASKV